MSPISNASKLADFGSGIGTAGAVLQVDNVNKRIGIGTTNPQSVFQVGTGVSFYGDVGIVSCTEVRGNTFYGDGSNLTGLATTETVRADTLTVAGVSTLTGVTNVTGTANFASAVNVDATTDSTSTTTGALIVDGGVGIAKNVYIGAGLSVAGTLTYEDVTNVDSVGVVTAKSGVNITGGQLQVGVAYSVGAAGVATATGFVATSSPTININDGATEKGYIGFNGNDPFIGRKNGVGLLFQNNKIRPADGDDGSATTNTADIGEPTYKFKDLYLAGEANANGLIVGSGITFGSAGVATFSGTADVHLLDNVKLNIGDGPDLQLSHSGTNSVIDNNTGGLYIRNNVGGDVGGDIYIQAKSGENSAIFTHDGSAALHYDNAKKFETTNDGVVITGICTDSLGNVRDIPLRSVTGSAATLVVTDAGKVVSTNTTGWTVPASTFDEGDTVSLLNNSAGDLTITCSAVTTYLTSDGSTVTSSTLGARGMATLYFVSASVAYLQGTSLS